jgi:hypothetical protein
VFSNEISTQDVWSVDNFIPNGSDLDLSPEFDRFREIIQTFQNELSEVKTEEKPDTLRLYSSDIQMFLRSRKPIIKPILTFNRQDDPWSQFVNWIGNLFCPGCNQQQTTTPPPPWATTSSPGSSGSFGSSGSSGSILTNSNASNPISPNFINYTFPLESFLPNGSFNFTKITFQAGNLGNQVRERKNPSFNYTGICRSFPKTINSTKKVENLVETTVLPVLPVKNLLDKSEI